MGKQNIYLTSRGLNTKMGRNIIGRALSECNKSGKILMVTIEEYRVNSFLYDAAVELGFSPENIVIYDGSEQKDIGTDFAYIYVGEGNTFQILDMMRKHGIIEKIHVAIQNGAAYIGSSAGAMIAGKDIALAHDFDRNFVGMSDFRALELFQGTIIPHYTKDDLICYLSRTPKESLERYQNIYSVGNGDEEGETGILILDGTQAETTEKRPIYHMPDLELAAR